MRKSVKNNYRWVFQCLWIWLPMKYFIVVTPMLVWFDHLKLPELLYSRYWARTGSPFLPTWYRAKLIKSNKLCAKRVCKFHWFCKQKLSYANIIIDRYLCNLKVAFLMYLWIIQEKVFRWFYINSVPWHTIDCHAFVPWHKSGLHLVCE